MVILDILIFSKLLYQMYCPSTKKQDKVHKISAFQTRAHIICFCCILFTGACDIAHAVGAELTGTSLMTEIRWISYLIMAADFFYFSSSVLIYSILIHRLHSTFYNTIYGLSRSSVLFAIFIISIQSILMILYTLNVGFNYHQNASDGDSKWIHVGGVLSAFILTLDAVLNFFLFALFIRKLRQSVMLRLDSDTESMTITDALSHKSNTKILDVITKQTLLGISVTFCSAGFTLTSFASEAFGGETEWDYCKDYVVRSVEGVMISLLLFLGLQINAAAYKRVCGRCHQFCRNYRLKKIQKHMSKGYYPMNELEDSL